MNTSDVETRLRATLEAKAATVIDDGLVVRGPSETSSRAVIGLSSPEPASGNRRLITAAVAAAAAVVVGIGGGLAVRRDAGPPETPLHTHPASPGFASPAPSPVWPLSADGRLPGPVAAEQLSTPESAAHAYLSDVVGLPATWPLRAVVTWSGRGRATAEYVVQDVAASLELAHDGNGLWFVSSATTEQVRAALVSHTETAADVRLSAGPRTPTDGLDIRLRALAADGRVLGDSIGHAAARSDTLSIRWNDDRERPVALRGDVLDDVDGDPSTPPVVVGHFALAIPGPPALALLPPGVDVHSSEPVFRTGGDVDTVAAAYLRSRFPDFPSPGVKIDGAVTRGHLGFVRWAVEADVARGTVILRRTEDRWDVVAATTDGVDLSGLRVEEGRLGGSITTDNINALFADVLQPDGAPVPSAPRPDGQPGAAYRFGTAGGPGEGALELDVVLPGGPVVVRASLVGGTILAVSEVVMAG
jgi:hypothetical protein